MKLYGICIVKNEADVIAQSLTHALKFCDQIFVIDNGSSDGTWETVKSLAQQFSGIVPFAQILEPFRDSMRSLVYNRHHHQLSDRDWWLRLDADEFLDTDPRPILVEANLANADFIQAWQAQFYYTDVDHQAWLAGKEDRNQPIVERRRYYRIDWREYRLFRNQPDQVWDETTAPQWPNGLTKIYNCRILNRHYQYRDPEQITKRLKQRYGHAQFQHVTSTNWETEIRAAKDLHYYQSGQPLHVNLLNFYAKRVSMKILEKLQQVPIFKN